MNSEKLSREKAPASEDQLAHLCRIAYEFCYGSQFDVGDPVENDGEKYYWITIGKGPGAFLNIVSNASDKSNWIAKFIYEYNQDRSIPNNNLDSSEATLSKYITIGLDENNELISEVRYSEINSQAFDHSHQIPGLERDLAKYRHSRHIEDEVGFLRFQSLSLPPRPLEPLEAAEIVADFERSARMIVF